MCDSVFEYHEEYVKTIRAYDDLLAGEYIEEDFNFDYFDDGFADEI
jgi:hypothetical protein